MVQSSPKAPGNGKKGKNAKESQKSIDPKKTENLVSDSNAQLFLNLNLSNMDKSGGFNAAVIKPEETEIYHGVKVKSLASFETFDIDPKVCDLKWTQDHTSGKVHSDMTTISMLYNQNLTLPDGARKFIAQSTKLEEEAKWERQKAIFYSLYPKDTQEQAYQILAELSVLEASRVIAMKNSRCNHEAILKPTNEVKCDSATADRLNEEIKIMIEKTTKDCSKLKEDLKNAEEEVQPYSSFKDKDSHELNHIKQSSQTWSELVEKYQDIKRRCIEVRLFLFHLKYATARFDPRTEWIHIRTTPLFSNSNDESLLFTQVSKLFSFEYPQKVEISKDETAAIDFQFEKFEAALQKYGTGPFENFDSLHNNDSFQAYEFLFPYGEVNPKMCASILCKRFPDLTWKETWEIVSKPVILDFPKEFHEAEVYFKKGDHIIPNKTQCKFGATLKVRDSFEFCFNCFEKDHFRRTCRKDKLGYNCGL